MIHSRIQDISSDILHRVMGGNETIDMALCNLLLISCAICEQLFNQASISFLQTACTSQNCNVCVQPHPGFSLL
jgi:hypothetical protein